MDKTKTYIKMCGCPEVQGQWKHKVGNWVHAEHKTGAIWLPRQDQIQEMIFDEDEGIQTIATDIAEFSVSQIGSSISIQGTMEQLLLAFYMHEKHNLFWENDKWTKI